MGSCPRFSFTSRSGRRASASGGLPSLVCVPRSLPLRFACIVRRQGRAGGGPEPENDWLSCDAQTCFPPNPPLRACLFLALLCLPPLVCHPTQRPLPHFHICFFFSCISGPLTISWLFFFSRPNPRLTQEPRCARGGAYPPEAIVKGDELAKVSQGWAKGWWRREGVSFRAIMSQPR